ncbi:phosphoglycerate kinase [Erysipelotrichaceae bacterium OttesenSCG-928-M19]|nr:phosphoglycerate kinase [Erysipelotrichaceae bacterium OttesenSCG-928-M19]
MMKKTIRDLALTNKKVLVRCDFNVPFNNGEISDDNRIRQALPTIKYLIEHKAKIILCSHLGKIKSEEDKKNNSLAPVAKRLSELLNQDVIFVAQTRGQELEDKINSLQSGEVILFENTRFEPGETNNDEKLAQYWGSLTDFYVNDAFGSAHRAHASTFGVSNYVEDSAIGFLIEKELDFIGNALANPKRPLIAILGGAKVGDKISVIDNLLKIADKVIIGGGMSYTFIKAQGYEIGKSLVEEDKIELAKEYLSKAEGKLVLPIDSVCASEFSNEVATKIYDNKEIPSTMMGLDIGPKTIALYQDLLKDAKTVLWNGPMGVFEMSNFAKGTIAICKALANLDATTIIGGGDSAAAAISLGFADDFSHISTGGGASLEFMEGKKLPGIEAIADK